MVSSITILFIFITHVSNGYIHHNFLKQKTYKLKPLEVGIEEFLLAGSLVTTGWLVLEVQKRNEQLEDIQSKMDIIDNIDDKFNTKFQLNEEKTLKLNNELKETTLLQSELKNEFQSFQEAMKQNQSSSKKKLKFIIKYSE